LSKSSNWKIIEPEKVRKKFHELGEPQKSLFVEIISDFKHCDDPRLLGTFKKGKTVGCFVTEVTKSFRLKYDVDYSKKIIYILDIDDHKGTYGKD
jgi:mRNA-degrading endonuclease RelE of RelBE toxin-antitoxin system